MKLDLTLFGIKYDEWTQVCQMYFSVKKGVKQSYLQFFPFSKLTTNDIKKIKSEDFFKKYIQNGGFLFHKNATLVTDNYILKADNSFRDVKLISEFLFLVLQTIGFTISSKYTQKRPSEISVYYAGSYLETKAYYKKEYNKFYKEINNELSKYKFFIKTDVRSFFSNIDLDKLIEFIDKNCNESRQQIFPIQLFIWKLFFSYCGEGGFPCNENSLAASFLATIVYLEESDIALYNFLKSVKTVNKFKMIRYVDDLYILIDADFDSITKEQLFNIIYSYYSSILKEYNLSLNYEKCGFFEIEKINEVVKQSLYDEYSKNIKFKISSFYKDDIIFLLDHLIELSQNKVLSSKEYRQSINSYLTHKDIEFSSLEIFNYFIYNNDSFTLIPGSQDKVIKLFSIDLDILSIDPKLLTVLLLKTKNEILIKSFLNYEFSKYRSGQWTKYDSTVVLNYLLQRNFQHMDLKNCLSKESTDLKVYLDLYCNNSFLITLEDIKRNKISEILQNDWKSCFMYFMYIVEIQHKNYLSAFAYYKTYFDRITAIIENPDNPNYQKFYKEANFKEFYKDIEKSEQILKDAFKMRNDNPLAHAEAKLINEHFTSEKIIKIIENLDYLLISYLEKHDL